MWNGNSQQSQYLDRLWHLWINLTISNIAEHRANVLRKHGSDNLLIADLVSGIDIRKRGENKPWHLMREKNE